MSSMLTPKLGTNERITMMQVKKATSAMNYSQLSRRRNTNKINHITKLVKKQVADKAKKFDKCHGGCNHKHHQAKPPPVELLTAYDRMMTNLATPDFSLQSKSVKQIMTSKEQILESDENEY